MPANIFLLRVNKHMVEVIGTGLLELPAKTSMPVIEELNRQLGTKLDPCASCKAVVSVDGKVSGCTSDSMVHEDKRQVMWQLVQDVGTCPFQEKKDG